MSSPLKKLAGETAIYGLSSIIGRAVNFLLVPFYTGIFNESEYGIVGELFVDVAFLNILFLLGLETAYFRFSNKENADEPRIFNITQTTIFLNAVLISGVILIFSQSIADFLLISDHSNYIVWLALLMGIDAIAAIPFAQLRLKNQPKKYAFIKLTNIVVNVGLNLFFFIVCKNAAEGSLLSSLYDPEIGVGYVFLSYLLANALYIPLLLSSLSKWRFTFHWSAAKPMLIYSYPLMFAAMAGIVNELMDRNFLKYLTPEGMYPGFDNQAVVGIYNACYKLSIFMSLGIQAFRYAAEPFFFSQAKDKNSPELFSKVMNWFVIIGTFVFLFISLNLHWIAPIVIRGEGFRSGIAIVPILLLANLFLGIYYNLSIWFKLSEKTHWGTILATIGAFVTVVGNIALIPIIGYMGSAYTTLACYFTMALISYIIGQKHYPLPYQTFKIIRTIMIAVLLYYIGLQVDRLWYNLVAPIWFTGGLIWMERRVR